MAKVADWYLRSKYRKELHSLQIPNIVNMGNSLIVTFADTKTIKKRVFFVTADGKAINCLKFIS